MSQVISFIVAHEAVLSGLGVAVLDLLFALNSNLSGNGILHQIYVSLKGVATQPTKS